MASFNVIDEDGKVYVKDAKRQAYGQMAWCKAAGIGYKLTCGGGIMGPAWYCVAADNSMPIIFVEEENHAD